MPPITPAPIDIPDEETENVSSGIVENPIVSLSDSDSISDIENIDHNGYELLSQDPENLYAVENDDEDYSSESDIEETVTVDVNTFVSNLSHLTGEMHGSTNLSNCISSEMPAMDAKHIETIKSVMKGITLPSANLPQWANLVPEEEWKEALFSKMKVRKAQSSSRNKNGIHSSSSSNNNQFDVPNDVLR